MLLELAEKIVDGYFCTIPRKTPLPENIDKARLIAHRGAFNNSQGIIENTHEAFRLAKQVGCWGLELDVHATADGVLVVNHDPTLKRLWKKKNAISDLTFRQLRASVPSVPSLEEVVTEYGSKMHLFIELKAPFHHEEALIQVLGNLTPCTHYHLLSLEPSTFESFSQFPKQAMLLVAVHNNVKEFCNLSIKENYGGVMGNYLLLTNKRIKQLKNAHQSTGIGFVNSKNSLLRELNRGNYWLFTNQAVNVGRYLEHMKQLKASCE